MDIHEFHWYLWKSIDTYGNPLISVDITHVHGNSLIWGSLSWSHVILAPGASEGRLRGALHVALQPPCRILGISSRGSGDEFRQVIFCRLEIHLARNWKFYWPWIGPVGPKNNVSAWNGLPSELVASKHGIARSIQWDPSRTQNSNIFCFLLYIKLPIDRLGRLICYCRLSLY